jgi:hypothetical protein
VYSSVFRVLKDKYRARKCKEFGSCLMYQTSLEVPVSNISPIYVCTESYVGFFSLHNFTVKLCSTICDATRNTFSCRVIISANEIVVCVCPEN